MLEIRIKFFILIAILSTLFANAISLLYSFYSSVGFLIVILWTSWHIASLVNEKWFRLSKPEISSKNKAVLITGCDTGFGHILAIALNKRGFKVFAGCLDVGSEGAQELQRKAMYPLKMKLLQLDVTNDDDIDQAHDEVCRMVDKDEQLWGLVNNAGVGKAGFLEWSDFDTFYGHLFDVNVAGLVKITRKFLPLIRQSQGRVINVASVAGISEFPGLPSYSMTKHAVVAFSNALRREMKRFGVGVTTILPQGYKTNLTDEKSFFSGIWETTSEKVQLAYGGHKRFQSFRESYKNMYNTVCSDSINDVPDAIIDSLVSPYGYGNRIVCSYSQKPIWTIVPLLSSEFLDFIWSAI